MPSINMIAARRAEKHRLEQVTRDLVYAIAAEVGVFLVALSFMVVQLVSAQSQVSDLNGKIVKLKPQVDRIQTLEQQTAKLQPKLTALNDAREKTLYWYTSIQNLTDSLSNTSSLSSLASSGDPAGDVAGAAGAPPAAAAAGAQFRIQGTSLSQADVGQTMLRLNNYPQFDNVTLNFTQLASVTKSGSSSVNFQMTIDLHSIAKPKPAKAAASTGPASAGTAGDNNAQKS